MLKKIFPKLWKELESEKVRLQTLNTQVETDRNLSRKQVEILTINNAKLEEQMRDLSLKINELNRQVTPMKVKDVLRTLSYNKLTPDRLIVNKAEKELLIHCSDVVKAPNKGLEIYGVRIVTEEAQTPFRIRIKAFEKKALAKEGMGR